MDSIITERIGHLKQQTSKARLELKNLRQQVNTQKQVYRKDVDHIQQQLQELHSISSPGGDVPIKTNITGSMEVKMCRGGAASEWTADHADGASQIYKSPAPTGNAGSPSCAGPNLWSMKPIGYIQSIFKHKNGTPRQSGLVKESLAKLRIGDNMFNNPHHSLQGLQAFSHIWVIFVFHENKNTCVKAKVRPPRLDGAKTGLFSTRSPHRPNAIGLSLVAVKKIEGSTLWLSGVDMIDGTPVLDVKPYIPAYDMVENISHQGACLHEVGNEVAGEPQFFNRLLISTEKLKGGPDEFTSLENNEKMDDGSAVHPDHSKSMQNQSSTHRLSDMNVDDSSLIPLGLASCSSNCSNSWIDSGLPERRTAAFGDLESLNDPDLMHDLHSCRTTVHSGTTSHHVQKPLLMGNPTGVSMAAWISQPPIKPLAVSFTPRAEEQVHRFNCKSSTSAYRLEYLVNGSELKDSIISILKNDPRSVHRRKNCSDRLYYFTVDTAHITCWFEEDEVESSSVEVVRVIPVTV